MTVLLLLLTVLLLRNHPPEVTSHTTVITATTASHCRQAMLTLQRGVSSPDSPLDAAASSDSERHIGHTHGALLMARVSESTAGVRRAE